MGKLFGTDGVRGVANQTLTPEMAFRLGQAGGTFYRKIQKNRTRVLIGKDTRVSGDMLEAALTAGLTSVGVDVELLGIIPTPGVAYLCRSLESDGGVMISASHNPVEDNGIKFFDKDGYKLSDEAENGLEDIYFNSLEQLIRPISGEIGRVSRRYDAIRRYEDYLTTTTDQKFDGLKIVLDCGYGASFAIAPVVLRRLGAEVIEMNAVDDGMHINVNCGSTNVKSLKEKVLAEKADIGIAHDGDADRVIAVSEKGETIDGDAILAICGLDLLKRGKLKGNHIAATVYSNLGLSEAFKEHGANVFITANGDRYVLEALRRQDWILGGEQSGHIIFLEKNTTGDGVLTAIQLISVMKREKEKISVLAQQMKRFPQVLQNVRVARKDEWENNDYIGRSIAEAHGKLAGVGRVLVRPSGTEPLIRIMAEGPDEEKLKKIVADLAEILEQELN